MRLGRTAALAFMPGVARRRYAELKFRATIRDSGSLARVAPDGAAPPARRPDTRDKGFSGRGRVGLSGDRTRASMSRAAIRDSDSLARVAWAPMNAPRTALLDRIRVHAESRGADTRN